MFGTPLLGVIRLGPVVVLAAGVGIVLGLRRVVVPGVGVGLGGLMVRFMFVTGRRFDPSAAMSQISSSPVLSEI